MPWHTIASLNARAKLFLRAKNIYNEYIFYGRMLPVIDVVRCYSFDVADDVALSTNFDASTFNQNKRAHKRPKSNLQIK